MSPTVARYRSYRFFFNSREEKRRHVHVSSPDGTAKFWLEPVIALASFHKFKSKELREIDALVREHEDEIRSAWDRHFLESGHKH